MPHSDFQKEFNDQQTPTQVDPQMRDLRFVANRMPTVQEASDAEQSARPRTPSAKSQRSAFSAIVEEDVGSSQVGSPERMARMPSSPRYFHLYIGDTSTYLPYEIGMTSETFTTSPRALDIHLSATTPESTPLRRRWKHMRPRPHPL